MSSFPLTLWGGWAAGITLLGLLFLAWLSLGVWTARPGSIAPPDDVWDDDLREGNSTPPKWWFYALFGTLIFSAVYITMYPGFGDNTGFLQWTQKGQLDSGLKNYLAKTETVRQRWETAPLAELRTDASAMASARRLFNNNCAACHGADAAGQAGLFPNLTDSKWQWGGRDEQIIHSITAGRVAAMPAWAALGEDKIRQSAAYVLSLAGEDSADAEDIKAGRQVYTANCAACHGMAGEGNAALGAPGFAGGYEWVYRQPGQSKREAIEETIRHGRNGVMPAQKNRLQPGQIRLLAAWLGGGIETAPPQ